MYMCKILIKLGNQKFSINIIFHFIYIWKITKNINNLINKQILFFDCI